MAGEEELLSKLRYHIRHLEESLANYSASVREGQHQGKHYVDSAEGDALEIVDLVKQLPTERSLGEKMTNLLRPTHGHKKTRAAMDKFRTIFRHIH